MRNIAIGARWRWTAAIVALACAAVAGGCGGAAVPPITGHLATPQRKHFPLIKHVVMIDLENRSYDNLFHGFPGGNYATTGVMHDGTIVTLTGLPLTQANDIGHSSTQFAIAYDGGKNDAFDLETLIAGNGQTPPPPTYPYTYVNQSDVQPYWDMASQYALADRMFQSNGGASYPSHFYLIAAQSDSIIGNPNHLPWGCDAPAHTKVAYLLPDGTTGHEFPCIDMPTIADELDAAGVTWASYTPQTETSWEAYESVSHIRFGPDWNTNFPPSTHIFTDPGDGQLPSVSWVIPTFTESDHPRTTKDTGPSWVASVVNAIGESPYWPDTAIFITWDDWGGWYDHVPPPQLDKFGLGFRVPLIVVSPYSRHGYVSHTRHEFGSIIKFIEETYGLPSLGQTDARADDLTDMFDFQQTPAPFVPIKAPLKPNYFMHEPIDWTPLDDDLGQQ